MTLEEAIRAQMLTYGPLTALIEDRVYAMWISETATLPAVTMTRISAAPLLHRGGSDYARVRYQIDGWATTFTEALQLRPLIKASLKNWQRLTDDSPRVDATIPQDDRAINEAQPGRWRVSMDLLFSAKEGS